MFYSKDEATDFDNDIANADDSISFKNKAKLLRNTEALPNPNHAIGILKNTTFAVSLKYLSNFWRSLEMPLINFKVEIKLSAAGNDNSDSNANSNANSNSIILTIKDTKLYVPFVTLSEKGSQKLSKLLSKGFQRSGYSNEYETKVIILLESIHYLF